MNPFYPVLLRVAGMPVLVVGGGRVAATKVEGLLRCGARVTVVAPELGPELARLAAARRLAWRPRPYRNGDLRGFWLAIAATDDPALNRRVWEEARRRRIWVNAVDDPEHCTFILPAVHRQGDLILAVSTSGRSPALAVRLRDRFARELGPAYARWLELLGSLRDEVRARYPDADARAAVWYRIVDSDAFALLSAGQEELARARVRALLAEGPPAPVDPIGEPPGEPAGVATLPPGPGARPEGGG